MYESRLSDQHREKAWMEEKEAQHRSACLILISGREAGWQRDGGPSRLFGLPRDDHLSPALHGCLYHYLHSARFPFKCWGMIFSPPPSVWSLSTEKESIKDQSTWVTFLMSSSQDGVVGGIQRLMTAREQSLLVTQLQKMLHFDNIQIIILPQHISNFPFWSNTEKKNNNCIIFFEILGRKVARGKCKQSKEMFCRSWYC